MTTPYRTELLPDVNAKTSWPECVGKTREEAQAIVTSERPDCRIEVVGATSPVTFDYRTDRVRIFYNETTLKVDEAPMIG